MPIGSRLAAALLFACAIASAAEPGRVLIVVGPSTHPPGSHEVAAGGRVMEYALEHASNVEGIQAEVVYEWPSQRLRDTASTVVFIGDTFPANRFPNVRRNLADLQQMMNRGAGIVSVHYATGLRGHDVAPDGDHPLLRWMGGYFANRTCPHHESIAKVFESATIEPAAPGHPVSRGWKAFTVHDEPYIHNYFGKDHNRPAPHVTIFATSMLPPEEPERQAVAWGVERRDGGRGFGIVMPHFYKNWAQPDLRKLILNAIIWSAKLPVPENGVESSLPNLEQFNPEAVEYTPRSR